MKTAAMSPTAIPAVIHGANDPLVRSDSKPRLARRSVMMRWMRPNFTRASCPDSDDAFADAARTRGTLGDAEPLRSGWRGSGLKQREKPEHWVGPDRRIGTDSVAGGCQHADTVT